MSDEYIRTHPIRACREECAEAGYSGDSFHECVKKCVERAINNNR